MGFGNFFSGIPRRGGYNIDRYYATTDITFLPAYKARMPTLRVSPVKKPQSTLSPSYVANQMMKLALFFGIPLDLGCTHVMSSKNSTTSIKNSSGPGCILYALAVEEYSLK